MSDHDRDSQAWLVAPSRYLEKRPATFAVSQPRSQYVPMRDGCRLAVDVYLPAQDGVGGRPPAKHPTIVLFTPYYRRFKVKRGAPAGTEPSPNAGRYRDFFVPRGYALVVADVRGTGASFGTRDGFRSPVEREDYREVVDWIVRQEWSDGAVGSTGVSYPGAAADFLASTGHPAVKAVAPLFAVWDTYSDHYYPGGLLLNRLASTYDELMIALDHDRRELLGKFAYFKDPNFEGPQPVDDDADGALCRDAVREHLGNFHMPDFITEFRFRDDTLPYDPGFSSASFSPSKYAAEVREDVAVYSVSGWMDGAGYTNGAFARFLTLPNRKRHLLLGPWDHGARINVSPWRDGVEARFPILPEILRFFDHYLAGRETGLEREAPIHYFTMGEEAWRAAEAWPPFEVSERLHLAADFRLEAAPGTAGADKHRVDFSRGTGTQTRYERLAAIEVREYYADWSGRDEAMLSYTSAPLPRAMALTGHPVLEIWVSADQPDAAIHAYLEEIEADGTVRYVTEGMLRALHRKETPCPLHHRTTWPFRSFARRDAAPLVPGEAALLRFALLPTSWRFRAGSRVRLAIAGADSDHYGQVPHGRPPLLKVHHGGETPSALTLPWAATEDKGAPSARGGRR
jgi:putative CocE/NonD family hydrolase